jgi:hypothetical protein
MQQEIAPMNDSTTVPTLPKPLLLLIALLQGLLLFVLHEAIEFKFWPHDQPQWLFSFYSMVVVAPLMLLLALEQKNGRKLLPWVVPFALACGLLGCYVGWQAIPLEHIRMESLLFAFVCTLTVATFKTLMYAQQHATGEAFSYSHLFRFSWRNFLTLGLAFIFTLSVWGVLMLWGELFKVIKIDFFYDLFKERWFYYPALALANGFGIIIFRNQAKVIDTITRIQQALMKFLLVILVLVSLLFLAALPFTGLTPLWATGSGSLLILWLQALMLFFLNAVYQDDAAARPYPTLVHRFIYIGVASLPIYSAIAFYGLTLRVEQYGWSVGRCWGFLLWGFFALFSLGYLWGIIKQRDAWLERLSWVNVRMGLLVLVAMLLINSPLLDFRKISVASQLARLDAGKVKLVDVDFYYFRRELARPGYTALQKIKADVAETHPEIVIKIDDVYRNYQSDKPIVSRETFLVVLNKPDAEIIPDDLADALYQWVGAYQWRERDIDKYHLVRADLNRDGHDDYALLQASGTYLSGSLFSLVEGEWKVFEMTASGVSQMNNLEELLKLNQVEVVTPEWQLLKVGDLVLHVRAAEAM